MKTKQEIMLEVAKDDFNQTIDIVESLARRATRWLIIYAVAWLFFVAATMAWVEDWDINWIHKVQVVLAHIAIVPMAFAMGSLLNVLKGSPYSGNPDSNDTRSRLDQYDSAIELTEGLIIYYCEATRENFAKYSDKNEKIKSARTSTKWAVRIFLCALVVGVFA